MRELPANSSSSRASKESASSRVFATFALCAPLRDGVYFCLWHQHSHNTLFNARRKFSHICSTLRAYIICAPNGLCVILRILSFCAGAKFGVMWLLFARLFLLRWELFWQGREENCSAGSQKDLLPARHHLKALFDGSLIAHQIFGEKLMNGPPRMTQLYACSSNECFYLLPWIHHFYGFETKRVQKWECHQHSLPEKHSPISMCSVVKRHC